jgi:hypothetical protein
VTVNFISTGPRFTKDRNRKLGRTTVVAIYDRFTKRTDFRYTKCFGRKLPTGSEQS